MDIKSTLQMAGINAAGIIISRLANPQIWVDSKMFANDLMNKDMKGKEKHEKIKADLQTLFKDDLLPFVEEIAGALLDGLIKFAFIYVTTKAQQK